MISIANNIYKSLMVRRMKTVQLTLQEDLLAAVDAFVRSHATTRSAFARKALWEALRRAHEADMEAKHREGYARYPASEDESMDWESEQAWGDE
jgi:metal-responsive CopG/Arc/MetJ family transcriptional regulator